MAELSTADRQRIWRGLQRYWSRIYEIIGAISKDELRAAVDATDTWVNDNQGSFNNALPAAAKAALTMEQKTLLFCAVALMRVDPGTAALLRRIFGEVD